MAKPRKRDKASALEYMKHDIAIGQSDLNALGDLQKALLNPLAVVIDYEIDDRYINENIDLLEWFEAVELDVEVKFIQFSEHFINYGSQLYYFEFKNEEDLIAFKACYGDYFI